VTSAFSAGSRGKRFPTHPVYEDHDLVAFDEHPPGAPVHVLIVPKEHMVT